MAWRIADSVERGEIDNRERGMVRGRLWIRGLPEPIQLELAGNASPDVAGCLLSFENTGEAVAIRRDPPFAIIQRGTVGDLTASKKVRVYDLPTDEAFARLDQGLTVPEHIANCLYVEWFSNSNGRVVIESPDYKLSISPPAWKLSKEEEEQRQKEAAEGFVGFMQKLDSAIERASNATPVDKEFDEFDYEKLLREGDARTDKLMELYDKYQDDPNLEEIIAREMGWTHVEDALAGEEEEESDGDLEEAEPFEGPDEDPELEPDPATEGVDWVRDEHGYFKHPLAKRASEGALALTLKYRELNLDESDDLDLLDLEAEYQITAAKLAGALNSLAYGRSHHDPAFVVAYLKRALGFLQKAQARLENVIEKKLLPAELTSALKTEFFALREEILRLMAAFRKAQ
ncbi:MAG: hypothetical protein JWM16_5969 [Verrucomicrobiales bacterium]|nr:hypothetical protein [Verrucomicrobiales bacterium]